jgi:pimeloyl-ACP methyl ester carboxylesterase
VDKLTDILKIIVSTDEINPALLEQDDIKDVRFRGTPKSADASVRKSALGRLMRRVHMRGVGAEAGTEETISDWMTTAVRLTTFWPLESVAIPAAGQSATVGGVLSVQGHSGLQAKAQLRLQPFDAASRDAKLPFTPPVLRSAPAGIQPFEFSPSRSAEPGHSGVELVLDNAADYECITPESPLVLQANQTLGPNESVLMVSYDRESGLYMPVGFGYPKYGGTEIRVENLPKPGGTDERNVKGTLLMLAYKLIPEKIKDAIGFENPYPLLRVATVGEDGVTRYVERGATHVRECVANAHRILLLVHGFTGDTHNMVASTRALYQHAPHLPKYDLLLAFDYESINTRMQDTAVQLRERLEQVGLGAGHGKTLDVVAHSLGAQVCRWFIEREGGNQVVSRLVMMGPPNAGTPLAVLQEWATHLIGLGLNGLLTLANPAAVIVNAVRFVSAVLAGIEKVDTTLDQLKLNSDFYRDINGSPDPMLPYFVVIGNTKEMKEAAAKTFFSSKAVHRILSLAFVDQPNDMAISVKSAEAVALLKPDRNPLPKVRVIDCDHLTYFNSEAGLKALAEYLTAQLA